MTGPRWEDLVAPRAIFAGIAVAFTACCVAGHLAGRHADWQDFARFHKKLSPETLFFPTARQVRAFGREHLDRGKIIVVVGGSSVLHGTGQRAEQVWTLKLQELLGEEYQVINFGLRCGQTAEFGEVAAEIFERDHDRVLLVSDLRPGALHPDPDGYVFKYFFWDAWCKHLLLPDPARDARLAEIGSEMEQLEQHLSRKDLEAAYRMPADKIRELQTEMALDSALYFTDLWNTAAYALGHTMWTVPTRTAFLDARRRSADEEAGALPIATRFARNNDSQCSTIRSYLKGCKMDEAGNWVEDPASGVWPELQRRAEYSFPQVCRRRTLMLVTGFGPHHLLQLSPPEQRLHWAMTQLSVRHLEKVGLHSVVIGENYAAEDYADVVHLSESGGAKLAADVAPAVRTLAQRLGYSQKGR
jgi:hypothetical protein